MQNGYIKLFRKIQDNPLWKKKPFDHARAWVDLILLANHKDGGYWLRGIWIEVKRGQVGWSELSLSKRWGWSRGKSRLFFDALKVSHQISQQNEQQNKFLTSCITIINYELYQGDDTAEKTAEKTAERQQKDSRLYTNKNDKNNKNVNNKDKDKNTPPTPSRGIARESPPEIERPKTSTGMPEQESRWAEFKAAYPKRNGKFLGEQEAYRRFCLHTDFWPQLIQAAKNYGESQAVKTNRDGQGIYKPANFIGLDHLGAQPWREWVEPETTGPPVECPEFLKHKNRHTEKDKEDGCDPEKL